MNLDTLVSLGINEKSARIFLAALSLGTATAQNIANGAGLKRPTAYLHLQELLKMGLIEKDKWREHFVVTGMAEPDVYLGELTHSG